MEPAFEERILGEDLERKIILGEVPFCGFLEGKYSFLGAF